MLRLSGWMILGVLLAPAVGPAQETYLIKLKEPGPGDRGLIEKSETTTAVTKVVDGKQKELANQTQKSAQTSVFQETILEREGKKRATKLSRAYEKAQVTKDGKTTDLPYQGKTVVIEKKEGKFHFSYEGGKELTKEEAQTLDQEFNRRVSDDVNFEKLLLPGRPVKVNETWKIDMGPIAKEMAADAQMELDAAKATGTGILKKVYKKDGRQYGEMAFKLEVPIKSVGAGPKKIAAQDGSKGVLEFTMDACIDGSAASGVLKGVVKFDLTAKLPLSGGDTGTLTVHSEGVNQETHKELPKKK
jgi:hypothetical protein